MGACRAPRLPSRRVWCLNRIVALALGTLALIAVACASPANTPDQPAAPPSTEAAAPDPTAVALPSFVTAEPATPKPNIVADAAPETAVVAVQDAIPEVVRELNPRGPKRLVADAFHQLLGRDDITPIYEPIIATAEEAQLGPDDLVIGLSIAGESRAYPIRSLRFREMVNDELGGVPILVTW